jgi:hypothetical protein
MPTFITGAGFTDPSPVPLGLCGPVLSSAGR